MKDIFADFKKGKVKTEMISIRVDKSTKNLLKKNNMSASAIFFHGLKDLKKKK